IMADDGLIERPASKREPHVLNGLRYYYQNLFKEHPLWSQAGIRFLEGAVYEVLSQGSQWKVVFIFDEAEEFFHRLPPEFFLSLRGVRDGHKQRVLYLTSSRRRLTELVDGLAAYKLDGPLYKSMMEGFTELFHEATHFIELFSYQDTRGAVTRFCQRYEITLNPRDHDYLTRALHKLTGGHAGLLRRSFLLAYEHRNSLGNPAHNDFPTDDVLAMLLEHTGVRRECAIMLESLPDRERDTLAEIAMTGSASNATDLRNLIEKRMVERQASGAPTLTIPLLAHHLRHP
ncbi:MAG: hypothetical protein JW910_22405, partial [Anaerolineae bacterium]|nr:hypothetical protein [Anaerolineae bacterium]